MVSQFDLQAPTRPRLLRGLVMLVLPTFLALGACGQDDPSPAGPQGPGTTGSFALQYSTYIGGNGFDEPRQPTLLSGGRLLFGARTFSADLPVTAGVIQGQYGGGAGDSYLGILSADGSSLEAATFFGGSGMERPAYGIDIASNGDIVFTSGTTSPDLPSSAGAYRTNLANPVPSPGGGYVCRVSADLRTLRWCTYTGGGWPRGGLTLDSQDNVLVVGRAVSPGFSTTPNAIRSTVGGEDDGFLLRLNSQGTSAIYATRIGGTGTLAGEVVLGAHLRSDGTISMTGATASSDFPTTADAAQPNLRGVRDGFFGVIDPANAAIDYLTLMGGGGNDGNGGHLQMSDGSIIVSGSSGSSDYPSGTNPSPQNAVLSRIAPDGSVIWSRAFGGSGDDLLGGPSVDSRGRLVLGGRTTSRDLPVTPDAFQSEFGGGASDGWLMIVSADGASIEYLTYIGGSTEDRVRGVAIGPSDELYLVGRTDGDFPTTPGALDDSYGGDTDGFVMKLVPSDR